MWKTTIGLMSAFSLCVGAQAETAPGVHDMKDQPFTANEVIRALAPSPGSRPAGATAEAPLNSAARRTRSLGLVSSVVVNAIPDATPRKLSMQLHFAFDSAEITESARVHLDVVGAALRSPELRSGKFLVSGHTDSQGRYDYNVRLSKRRADAVKIYLINNHQVDANRIVTVGKASDDLLDSADPTSSVNRRVQLEALD